MAGCVENGHGVSSAAESRRSASTVSMRAADDPGGSLVASVETQRGSVGRLLRCCCRQSVLDPIVGTTPRAHHRLTVFRRPGRQWSVETSSRSSWQLPPGSCLRRRQAWRSAAASRPNATGLPTSRAAPARSMSAAASHRATAECNGRTVPPRHPPSAPA